METVLETKTRPAPSLTHGAEIRDKAALSSNLGATLKVAAERSPQKGIRYFRVDGSERFQSYPDLLKDASCVYGALRQKGLQPGDKVIFQLLLAEEFIPAFWGCVLGGFVPVPVPVAPVYESSNNTAAKLQNAWTLLESPLVLASSPLAPAIVGFAAKQGLANFRVANFDSLVNAAPHAATQSSQPDDLALLLLTSGSTGLPKAVQLSHRNILSRSAASIQEDEFSSHDISLNWMPLDHVGGLVMFHIRDVFLGCEQIHLAPEIVLLNPLKWLDLISKHRVTNTWAPNFAFGLINDQAEAISTGHWDLAQLRFVLNGGEAIVSKTARRFLTLLAPHGLPATAMHPAWGMSETSSGVTSSKRFSLRTTVDTDPFVEVGGPLPGVNLRIVDRANKPVPEGEIGSLQVSGSTLTVGYYLNSKLNKEVFTSDGWFITGDLGIIKDGQLSITGREKDIIIVNGVNFYSHEIESVVEQLDGVNGSFTAACPIRLPGENTDRIAIFFSPTSGETARFPALIKAIRAAVVEKEGVNPDYVIPVSKESIPKTTIGKIQRSQLKQQFERGDYAAVVREHSGGATDASATPEWFYRPAWREAAPTAGVLPAGASFLFFADSAGLCLTLARELAAAGHPCTQVELGSEFTQLSETHFRLDPEKPAHLTQLFANLGRVPDTIVHAWTYAEKAEPTSLTELESAQTLGAYSLLHLTHALGKLSLGERTLRLLVVSSHTRAVTPADRINFAVTPLLGIVRTIPQELVWLDCHHLDLSLAPSDAQHVLAELRGWDRATESAWRGATRFQPCLEKALPGLHRDLPLEKGGLYLLSGGIGGIGLRLASYLLQHFQARLLIIGRTPLPPRAQWKSILAAGGSTSERIRNFESLEVLGGELEYLAADVADLPALQSALSLAEKKWLRPLDGVFHLAGVYHEAQLENETTAGLAAIFRPKVSGSWVLNEIARSHPGCLFVNFSSVISLFGSLSTGAYAAANNFLDAFSYYQRSACGVRSYNLLWSAWAETGMSRGFEGGEVLRTRGYLSIGPDQGLASLAYALRHDHPQLIVGIDGTNKNIQKYFRPEDLAAAAAAGASTNEKDNYVAPQTDIQKQMAAIWQEVLGVPQVGLKDNFFELGGRSLLAAKMFAKVHKALGKNLPIPALFKNPTIEQLSLLFLEQAKSSALKINVLQAGGTRPPLFLIPQPGKDGSYFQALAQQLGSDQPCFALQARSLIGASGPAVSIEDTAKLLAEEILSLTAGNIGALGGRGFGAILAWETARLLAAKKRTVKLVALFAPPSSAFFSREADGATPRYRLIKPSGSSGTGFLGRLFKKGSSDSSGPSKEMREERERYGETALSPLALPLVIFGSTSPCEPWRSLAGSDLSEHAEDASVKVFAERIVP